MTQQRFQNRGNVVIKSGDYVKFAPNTKKGILLAVLGDASIIGVSDSIIYPGKWGVINPLNVVKWNDIVDKPEIEDLKDGKSAYQLALDNGFVGTEQEWLLSLEGEDFDEEFETVSKNLKNYPYNLTYGVDGIDTITYNLGGGLSIIKTFNYVGGVLSTIVLSGDTPLGIELTKTFGYTGVDLTSVIYS